MAFGYKVAVPKTTAPKPAKVEMTAKGFVLQNGLMSAKFNREGRLTSFAALRYDREGETKFKTWTLLATAA